jgi:redox-sensitive bicupin YhaK (pirin superfamily)
MTSVGLAPSRAIAHRTRGHRHGPITRLMSPGDLGQVVKPFVFLDLFEVEQFQGRGFAPHPHSGIATVTVLLQGGTTYADSTGAAGVLSSGAVEWMRAGGGVWHAGDPVEGRALCGYQLWLALPPELELAPAESLYVDPGRIPGDGHVRVLIGSYRGMTSPIPPPSSLTYLHVRLADGERWTYQPDTAHDVAWLATNSGKLHVSGVALEREMAVFEENSGAIELLAEGAVEFVIGSAAKHPYPLVSGSYSIHTNEGALTRGERNIAELARSPAVISLRRR